MLIGAEQLGHDCVALAKYAFVLSDQQNVRVIVLISHAVAFALLLELLVLHRG